MLGDGEGAAFADVLHRGPDGHGAGVALGGGGHVDGGLAEGELGFGHADFFDDVEGGGGDDDRVGVGVAYVLAGEDGDAAGDETGIFAGFEHARYPVDGGVGVAAAHGFDQGAGGVVVLVADAVVDDGFALDGFFGDG